MKYYSKIRDKCGLTIFNLHELSERIKKAKMHLASELSFITETYHKLATEVWTTSYKLFIVSLIAQNLSKQITMLLHIKFFLQTLCIAYQKSQLLKSNHLLSLSFCLFLCASCALVHDNSIN